MQGLSEFGIFSTSFHGSELPYWLSYNSTGSSSIRFDVPNHDIQGLNLLSMRMPEHPIVQGETNFEMNFMLE